MKSTNSLPLLELLLMTVYQLPKSDAENIVLSNNFDSTQSFDYHNFGEWGEWERCPEGKYATAFQIRNDKFKWSNQDNTGVNAIALYCNAPAEHTRDNYLMSSAESKGDWGEIKDCNDGLLNSFQLYYYVYRGPGGYRHKFNEDDSAATDFWFYCVGDNPATVKTGMSGGGMSGGGQYDKWTPRKTCPKGEAICGLRTQVAKYQANKDNVGLNNAEFECCPILSPAKTCIPVDRMEMVTECDNIGGTSPLTCSRSMAYGTFEANTTTNTTKEESTLSKELGFTLKEEKEILKLSFSAKLGQSDLTGHEWKTEQSSTFSEYVTNTFSFDVPPGTMTQLYQVVGQCGPYISKTLQMTKVDIDEDGNSRNEVPFVVEVDEGEKNSTEEEKAQHTVISNDFKNSRFYQNWGDWGEWERCPKGKFATAFQIKNQFYSSNTQDNTGVNGISLYCNAPGDRSRDKYVTSSTESNGDWGEEQDCNNGLLNSFQLAYLGYQGVNKDDAAVIDVWLYCVGDNPETVKTGMSGGGTTTSQSQWTDRKTCLKGDAICGIRTQISKYDQNDDNVGLNNVKFACCPIIGPAVTCEPSDQMDLVTECNNIEGSTPFSCSRSIYHGTSESSTTSNTTKEESTLLKELGINLKVEGEALKSAFSFKLGKSDTTSHEWKSETSSTFGEYVTTTVSFDVPAGATTKLYQVMGQCGPYIVRTMKLMRIDYDGDGNEIGSGYVEVEVEDSDTNEK